MLVLGISGGPSRVHEEDPPQYHATGGVMGHDGAAALLRDGEVVAAIEEERLNRIKHSNKVPVRAIESVLESARVRLADVDAVAFYFDEAHLDWTLRQAALAARIPPLTIRDALRLQLLGAFGVDLPKERFRFVPHHRAHAASAFYPSGFERSLVVTLDGRGERDSGSFARAGARGIETLRAIDLAASLGDFYVRVIAFLGYRMFDEYKVMGLAPYGDARRFREDFAALYALEADGGWRIDGAAIDTLWRVIEPRRPGEPIEQVHQDFAAALQEALERMAMHALRYWQHETGETHLCLAGGVAHNCTLNGRILSSGLFERVFVQPVAHDAGCALGAALAVSMAESPDARPRPLRDLYFGPALRAEEVASELERWKAFVSHQVLDDAPRTTARLLADGAVVGWVQGRSEFGPRALGNRSILADPRPAANKDRINAMVKKREAFRPFAPAVLLERAAEFFETTPSEAFPFMIFVLGVREPHRALLGAVTHVDGSARVQTVSADTNPRFWALIHAFGELTGCPVVLNTSFNNDAEPIVETARDAIVCFLTTELDYLVVGDHLVEKKPAWLGAFGTLCPELPPYVKLVRQRGHADRADRRVEFFLTHTGVPELRAPLSPSCFEFLDAADGATHFAELTRRLAPRGGFDAVQAELYELWRRRLVRLTPAGDRG